MNGHDANTWRSMKAMPWKKNVVGAVETLTPMTGSTRWLRAHVAFAIISPGRQTATENLASLLHHSYLRAAKLLRSAAAHAALLTQAKHPLSHCGVTQAWPPLTLLHFATPTGLL